MARFSVDGFELIERRMAKMGRPMIRQIIEAGAKAAEERMAENIKARKHVRTSDMLDSVGNNGIRECMGGASTEVYPQGEDRHGVSNTVKAFVINYGRGKKKRTARMGDKFITGHEDRTEQVVTAAMQAEADRLVDELNR